MEDNLDRLDVGGHDDELANTSVEGLGGLVGTGVRVCSNVSLHCAARKRKLTPS